MKSVLAALAAIVLMSASARAQDDPLPQSVAQPYLDYETAMEAGDGPVAMAAARQAWRAADDSDLSPFLVGILASNYADLLYAEGDYGRAADIWRRAAEIGDEDAQTTATERARRWYMAALSAVSDGDRIRGRIDGSRAVSRIESANEVIPASLRAEVYFLYTSAVGTTGAWWRIENSAGEAIAALEELGAEPNAMYAYCYYMLGLSRFFWGDTAASAFPFHMAGNMYASLGDRQQSRAQSAAYWFQMVQHGLTDEEAAALEAAIAASPYAETPSDLFGLNADTASLYDTDAQPTRRTSPQYPESALVRGINGIALARYDVTENGDVENIEVVASAPPQFFDEAVIEAVEDWRFEPAVRDGQAVRRPGRLIEFRFSICEGSWQSCRREAAEEE